MIREVFVVFAFVLVAFGSPVPDDFQDRSGRIVGGTNAPLGRFPWMASLQVFGSHFCGASIITNRWAMSAAHCITNLVTTATSSIVVGTVMTSGAGGVTHRLTRIINHPNFVQTSSGNDVCVMQTTNTIVFNTNVRSIELGSAFVGGDVGAIVIGFGHTRQGGTNPTQLQQLSVRTITNAQCGNRPQTILCTSPPSGQGACNGDSGGPLSSAGMQIGIASFTTGTCGNGLFDGYARVSALRSWVLNTIQ